jgi:hypothetical protein
MRATYSPEDNKLRLRSDDRLDPETYQRVADAGFKWASVQKLFVAPAWSPERADLLLELTDEIGDEDTTLEERAAERAERFESHSATKATQATAAAAAVETITGGIPLGQPILVGHHSERRARRDAERIERGLQKVVDLWDSAEYWTRRAGRALKHAAYKERPDVRARRIKGLEADLRRHQKAHDEAGFYLRKWRKLHESESLTRKDGRPTTFQERARYVANTDRYVSPGTFSALDRGELTPEAAQAQAIAAHETVQANAARWIAHYENRLAYERAMLAEAGGLPTDRKKPEVGGAIRGGGMLRGDRWYHVTRVNKVTVTVQFTWGAAERACPHKVPLDEIAEIMSAAEVEAVRDRWIPVNDGVCFALPEDVALDLARARARQAASAAAMPAAEAVQVRAALAAGVAVVSAPQLFPTPAAVADEAVALACIPRGGRVLEPSAGTGAILDAIQRAHGGNVACTAVEINGQLGGRLVQRAATELTVIPGDFLECTVDQLGRFDAVIMNPPFANGIDVKHIEHALNFVLPGGVLVGICANGPRQEAAFRARASHWRPLPAGTFDGTNVRAVLFVIRG